uniref:Sulfotransferase n=1 Tax=Hucho hucho TaxID=62062 RepID=A0A4W5NCA8_9TELE
QCYSQRQITGQTSCTNKTEIKEFQSAVKYSSTNTEWPEFVKNYAPWWASHTLDWLRYGRNVHVIHFEELKRDLFSKLKDMVLFLGLEVAENRLLCVEGQKDGKFKRSGLHKLD